MGNIYRRKSSGNEEDPFFNFVVQVPNRFKAAKNAAHTPGSFSRPEFLNKGAEPQTVTQCASHTAAVSLVRECDVLHGVRANVGSDVCLGAVSLVPGNLQVNADAVLRETDRLPVMSENGGAGASANVSRRLDGASAGANSWLCAHSRRRCALRD